MFSIHKRAVGAALLGAVGVLGHGHVSNIVINGESYQGYDPTTFPYKQDPPIVIGWATQQTDNGFIEPLDFGSPDIICHKSATPAKGHATVAAGDQVLITWNTWPESHHGPVIDYLAFCGSDGCENVDKEDLEFFKISEVGHVSGSNPGKWGSDLLVENNNSWLVEIPDNVRAGDYVLRHEIIALHTAGQTNGAQAYPQCINLRITGSGNERPQGVRGTELYSSGDPGIRFDLYRSFSNYDIPGPDMISGAEPVKQSSPAATATASATVGNGLGAEPTSGVGGGSGGGSSSGSGDNTTGNGGSRLSDAIQLISIYISAFTTLKIML
ncbi:hypothetical protein jhhlp_005335 [Lomentospora prolificans]|uniref:lytic cellulose monooxygenase (C4-dehydrogenating) n=1 Tax=Lomentospora prolificans TaxID=41688 RepID=A0A2N3N7H7_9PEZI|nr:hypothetical protein jhhlp_005335 [Lomentospora prolificans]